MRVRVQVIVPGTVVKVRRPRPGHREFGDFTVSRRLPGTHPNTDPAYDVVHARSGARRTFHASRLRVTRRVAPPRGGP